MQRRELFALAGLAAAAGAPSTLSQSENRARLIHVYATNDGESHADIIDITKNAGEIPVSGMTARVYERNDSNAEEWHTAPRKQFAINMTGELEVELSDGRRQAIGQGDLVYLEDVTGKGHITRVTSPVTNLFIHVPQNWDMLAWANA